MSSDDSSQRIRSRERAAAQTWDVARQTSQGVLWVQVAVLAFLYVVGTVLGGIGLGRIALHPHRRPVTAGEERADRAAAAADSASLEDVQVSGEDGTALRAWLLMPHDSNGNVVILLHGVTDNRLGMFGFGRWLSRYHYAVLLPDARGHGSSGGLPTYGLLEANDIHRWVSWLEDTYHPRCVYGLGESMGAAQLLQALSNEKRFCAVVADSSFATFREVAYARVGRAFHTGPWLGATVFRPMVDVGFLYIRLRYGFDMEKASPSDAVAASATPVLLIHGMEDHNIPPFHSDEIERRNPSHVVVWKVPGATHTGASQAAPREFERRVLDWFSTHPGR